jgi:GntR family transcriptional regulator
VTDRDNHDDGGPRFPPGGMELVYVQIADDIERRVAAGEWGHGDRLPSREQLAAEYGAAVMTVRRAQRELAERGLIRVVRGKGAYVDLSGGTPGAHDTDDRPRTTTNDDG